MIRQRRDHRIWSGWVEMGAAQKQQERAETWREALARSAFQPQDDTAATYKSDWQTIEGEPTLRRAPERRIPGDIMQHELKLLALQWLIIALNQTRNRLTIFGAW